MSKSLADLRAAPPQARPERSVSICLRGDIVAEVQALSGRLAALPTRGAEGDPQGPLRQGEALEHPDAKAIRSRLADLLAELAEYEGEMTLRANRSDGEWRNWVNEHPARAEGEPGYDRDQRVAYGFCDADALLDDLATYAHAWNGDPLAEGDYARIFEPPVATSDKAAMAQAVVTMYESRLDFPLLRSSLSANLTRWSAAGSPAASESPTSDSTDGSPAPSSEASTETASPAA